MWNNGSHRVLIDTEQRADHLVMAHLNSPMAEYFPAPDDGGAPDDDTLFWELFVGEPRAEGGFVTLPEKPGLGLELNEEHIGQWRIC